jgi:4-diphosphocytidyl-2-C-methyl-D-erythritol kinase
VTNGLSASLSPGTSITVHAPAKVNLILRILGRRLDGYHNLWSVMQTVALEDEVELRVASGSGINLTCETEGLSADPTNLVWKAASAVLDRARLSIGVEVELRKRIPMGAGLGGGSSDAAATIWALNRLLHLGWSPEKMAEVGQTLGSDVAFFLYAPSAIVSGRGEIVKPLAIEGRRWVVLVKPSFGVETKWAYQELATTRKKVRPLSDGHAMMDRRDRLGWSELAPNAENDFELPIFAKHPLLQRIKRMLLERGARIALLSGSGATVFGLFDDESAARAAGRHVEESPELKVFVVPTCLGPLRTSSSFPPQRHSVDNLP